MTNETTLLIHGGCHGAWCWDAVVAGLGERGIRAVAFDLPGCGADLTPRGGVTLASQVAVVVAQIDALENDAIRLVGHSIGGWLLAPSAAARPDRVGQLVFLAGAILNRGERGIDITPKERQQGYYDMAADSDDNTLMVSFDAAWDRFFNHLDEESAHEAYAKLTPQPFQPYLDPATVGIEDVDLPRRYIAPDDDRTYPADVTEVFAEKAGVKREILPGDHCVMLSAPEAVVSALVDR